MVHLANAQRAASPGFQNPFCILSVSTAASGPAIRQAGQRAIMQRRLAGGDVSKAQLPLLEAAIEILKDPVSRFDASLHWVDLTSEEEREWLANPTLRDLAFNRHCASQAYESFAAAASLNVRSHNSAVLLCADAHRLAEDGNLVGALALWKEGFAKWGLALASRDFSERIGNRARELDDPRLTSAYVRRTLDSLPKQLLAVPAMLAMTFLQLRRTKDAAGLVELIRQSPFSLDVIDAILQEIYKPLSGKVVAETERLSEALNELREAADGSSQQSIGVDTRRILDEFRARVQSDLEQMIELGDLPGLAEEHARDSASLFLEQVSLTAWNLGSDAGLAREAMTLAKRFADAESIHDKVDRALEAISKLELESEDESLLEKTLESIKSAVDRDDIAAAVRAVDAALPALKAPGSREALAALRTRICDNYAAKLFQEASELVESRRSPKEVAALLERAHKWVVDPEAKQVIASCLRSVNAAMAKQATGCLIPLVVLVCAALGSTAVRAILS